MIEDRDAPRQIGRKFFKTKVQHKVKVQIDGVDKEEIQVIENVFHARNDPEARAQLAISLRDRSGIDGVLAHFMAHDQNLDIQVITEEAAYAYSHDNCLQGFDYDPCICCEKRLTCEFKCFEEAGKACPHY